MPRTRRSSTANGLPSGDQPSAKAITVSRTTWRTSVTSTESVFAVISPQRGSGEEASRFRTPYRRSKPVAIAWPVNAVDITASARMPGARKSTALPAPVSTMSTALNSTSSSVGMTTVRSSCSPLRSSIFVSSAAWAAIMRGSGAAPGFGVYVPVPLAGASSRTQLLAGQLQEDVLQGVPLHRDLLRHHPVLGAPGRHRREQLRVDLADDPVRARRQLGGRAVRRGGP